MLDMTGCMRSVHPPGKKKALLVIAKAYRFQDWSRERTCTM